MTAILCQELQKLSVGEKLELVEQLWTDIAPESVSMSVPQSHQDELLRRHQRIAAGEASFTNWEDARQRIFSKVVG